MHVHVYSADGEAKYWIEPSISLAQNYGLSERALGEVRRIIEERKDEIRDSWRKHFTN